MSEPFRILRYEDAGTKADGSPMHNKYWVTVEVDGNEHKVGLRSVTYRPQVQKELLGHPLRSRNRDGRVCFCCRGPSGEVGSR